jgi:hypothetical protein
MHHITLPDVLVLLALGVLAATAIIAAGPGKRGPSRRLGACLIAGAALGAPFVLWNAVARHAQMAAAARASHLSLASFKTDALLGCTLGVALILFVLTTALQRKASQARPGTLPPARRRAGAAR